MQNGFGLSMNSFYLAILALLCAFVLFFTLFALFSSNLVFSIFGLVFVFFSGIWFFIFFRAEYAMVLFLIIYLGAIVVFFLFVLMLIDRKYWLISAKPGESGLVDYISRFTFVCLGVLFFGFLVFCLVPFGTATSGAVYVVHFSHSLVLPIGLYLTNTEKVGFLLYSEFGILVVLGGVVLLVAIVGCVLIVKPARRDLLDARDTRTNA